MDYLPDLPVTYTIPGGQTRWVGAVVIGLCALMWFASADTNPIARWAILGIGGVLGLALLIGPDPKRSYLTLTTEGFEFSTMRGKSFVAWNDVQAFSTFEYREHLTVTWYYTPVAKARGERLPKGSGVPDDSDGALPGSFGHQPARLALLMNDLLGKYGQRSLRNS